MIAKMKNRLSCFAQEEDGIALTEYLILLGLLTVAVITAVGIFGDRLGTLWTTWSTWLSGTDLAAPSASS